MGLIPDQTARHEITNRVSIHSPLNDAPCGIGEQVVNFSVSGTSANGYIAANQPEYILMVPFQAAAAFTPVSFDFEWLSGVAASYNARVILCDDTGKIVAFTAACPRATTASTLQSFAPTVTGVTFPAGVYYLGHWFTTGTAFDASPVYGCFGSLAANKVPNLRAMGCYSVAWNLLVIDPAAAIGDTLTFLPVQSGTQTNVVNGWVRCLTNV